jgi:hypothetical protein
MNNLSFILIPTSNAPQYVTLSGEGSHETRIASVLALNPNHPSITMVKSDNHSMCAYVSSKTTKQPVNAVASKCVGKEMKGNVVLVNTTVDVRHRILPMTKEFFETVHATYKEMVDSGNLNVSRVTAKVDGMPRKAQNSFIIFYMDTFNSNNGAKSSMESASEKWNAMNDEEKLPYVEKANADKERHIREMEAYNATTVPSPPKRARNPYNFFSSTYTSMGKSSIGAKWREFTDEQKAPYALQAVEDTVRYANELSKWKELMTSRGFSDGIIEVTLNPRRKKRAPPKDKKPKKAPAKKRKKTDTKKTPSKKKAKKAKKVVEVVEKVETAEKVEKVE